MDEVADICIVSEGAYPYYAGGVSGWVHELIQEHKERTFYVLTLMPPLAELTKHYEFPPNVIGHHVLYVQNLPGGASSLKTPKETWPIIERTLKGLISSPTFSDFAPFLRFIHDNENILGKRILCESYQAWEFILNFYRDNIGIGPFKDYFSTAYVLLRSLFSVSLPPLPRAKLYHGLCTGYAGFMLYRAKHELNAPCLLTEQGIYSNERRVEIAMADWISEVGSLNLALEDKKKSLKDFWLNAFLSLAHVCYKNCDEVISTFDGNQEIQEEGGADPEHMHAIMHGIKAEEYPRVERKKKENPIVAFIGRIVPIKDVRTFIRACQLIKEEMPNVRFHAYGPTDEDPEYFAECQRLVSFMGLDEEFTFFGKVNLKEYYPNVDVVVLTSISEAQPRVILEAGAMGIPGVATDVGACHQLYYGKGDEKPSLGQGGIVTALAHPTETATAVKRLLSNDDFYKECSATISQRIQKYYRYDEQHARYREFYRNYIDKRS